MKKDKPNIGRTIREHWEGGEISPLGILFCSSCGYFISIGVIYNIDLVLSGSDEIAIQSCPECQHQMTKILIFRTGLFVRKEAILEQQLFS